MNEDLVIIRGEELDLADLVDRRLFDPDYLRRLRQMVQAARPFPHLVVDGWFNPRLLLLMRQEFDEQLEGTLIPVQTSHESTYRTRVGTRLGSALALYCGIVNSGWFVSTLAYICSIRELLVDVSLHGGGMHESRAGGRFDVHRDFDRHPSNGLRNELVLITYLNPEWQLSWGGQLELWDIESNQCSKEVTPVLGRSVLMLQTPESYHGHPEAMALPEGVTRRSFANYYYSNPEAVAARARRSGTNYLSPKPIDRFKVVARMLTPPALWSLIRLCVPR